MSFQFGSVRSRFIVWFLLVALAPLITVIIVVAMHQIQLIRDQEFERLVAIRNLKVSQLSTWIDERKGDITTVAGDFELMNLDRVFLRDTLSREGENVLYVARELLKRYVKNLNDFEEFFILMMSRNHRLLFPNRFIVSSIMKSILSASLWRGSICISPCTGFFSTAPAWAKPGKHLSSTAVPWC